MTERIPPTPDTPPSPPPPRALQAASIVLLALWMGVTVGSTRIVDPVARAVASVEHWLGLDRAPGGET